MYSTKYPLYVKVNVGQRGKIFIHPGLFHSLRNQYTCTIPRMRLKAINSQVFPDFRTVNKIYAEPSNQKEWGMYMTGDIFFSYSKVYKNK